MDSEAPKKKKKSKPKKAEHVCSTWNVALGKAKLVCPECGKPQE